MNLLKSIFISMYLMVSMAITGYASWMVYMGGDLLIWAAVMLTAAPILLVISKLMVMQNQARTSTNLPAVGLLSGIGTAIVLWKWYNQTAGSIPLTMAVIGLSGYLIYIFWYSRFGRKPSEKIKVGDQLPDITLMEVGGKNITTEDLATSAAILIFYRGNWCPLCMAQIKEVAALYDEIDKLGVRMALISPQPHKNTIGLAKKFNVSFDFLTDHNNEAARTLGINISNGIPAGMQVLGYEGETVMPTVIIIDKGGEILWSHETDNYRVRPEPDVYLNILRENRSCT